MNIKEILDLKIGGQWLVSPAANETILCRESFSQEHKDIEKMVLKFVSERIHPNIKKIEKLDEDFSRSMMEEMGNLGLIGIDAPEEYGSDIFSKLAYDDIKKVHHDESILIVNENDVRKKESIKREKKESLVS